MKDKNIQEVNFISPEKGEKMAEKDCPIENTLLLFKVLDSSVGS